jgi:hypothetical protein
MKQETIRKLVSNKNRVRKKSEQRKGMKKEKLETAPIKLRG